MGKPGFWRKKFLVHKKFQLPMLGYFLIFYLITLMALYFFIRQSIYVNVENMKDQDPLNFSMMDIFKEHIVEVINFSFVIFGLIGGVFASIGGLVMSHKVAGPLHRLRGILQRMTSGQFDNNFQLRKSDFYGELYTDLQKLEETLSKEG